MSETRVPVDPNQPLDAGVYDIAAVVNGMDARQASLAQLQKGVTQHYGDQVQVLDYTASDPTNITLRVRVNPATTTTQAISTSSGVQLEPAQVLVALIYAASIVAFGFFLWRVTVNVKGTTKIVTSNPGTQIAAAGTGIGFALAGLAAVLYFVWPRRRARASA